MQSPAAKGAIPQPAMDGSIRIVALKGDEPVGAWEFEKETVTIGRSKTADVRLDDAAISRVHCIVEVRPAGVFIKDNGSRNGIWVNGRRVTEGLVSPRDEVVVERFRLKAYMVWGQNTAAKQFNDRAEVKTKVGVDPNKTEVPRSRPMPAPMKVAAPVVAKAKIQDFNETAPIAKMAAKKIVPAAPSLEETGAMAPVERPRATESREFEEILADVRPAKKIAVAAPAPKPAAKPMMTAKPLAKPVAKKAAAPVFVDYDEDEEEETELPAFSMIDVLATARVARPTEGKGVVEVIRYKGVNVLDVTRLDRGQEYVVPFTNVVLVSNDGSGAELSIGQGMDAELRKGSTTKQIKGASRIGYGELVDVMIDDIGYLVRVTEGQEPSRNEQAGMDIGAAITTGAAAIALHAMVAGTFMVAQMLTPEKPVFSAFAKVELPKEPEQIAAAPTPTPPPEVKPTPVPPMPKQPKAPPEKLAKRPTPQAQPVGGADRTEAKVASAGVLGGLGKVNVKLDSSSSALAAVTNLDAVRSTGGRSGGFKVSALTGKVPGDAVLGRAGRANGTVEISTLSGNDLGARGGYGGHALNGGGKVRGVVTQTPTANVGVQGSLSREEIGAVVAKHLAEIRRCYEKNLINDPSLNGKIQVEWTINPDGTVASVKTKFSSMKGGDVSGCIGGSIRSWQFPRPKGNGYVIVNYPFMFDLAGF